MHSKIKNSQNDHNFWILSTVQP